MHSDLKEENSTANQITMKLAVAPSNLDPALLDYVRTDEGKKAYKCDKCGKLFSRTNDLHDHVRTHTGEKPFQCTFCGMAFKQASYMKLHMRTHTGEKPFKCDECGKTYARSTDLQRHSQSHTGEKPHQCEICGKCYTMRRNLIIHTRSHTGEKVYECDTCGKSLNSALSLEAHIRLHDGVKSFKCDICGKEYGMAQSLKRHRKIHSEVKQCNICDKSFTGVKKLQEHFKEHEGKNPFTCDICGKKFKSSRFLQIHSRVHSEDNKPPEKQKLTKLMECQICGQRFRKQKCLDAHQNIHAPKASLQIKKQTVTNNVGNSLLTQYLTYVTEDDKYVYVQMETHDSENTLPLQLQTRVSGNFPLTQFETLVSRNTETVSCVSESTLPSVQCETLPVQLLTRVSEDCLPAQHDPPVSGNVMPAQRQTNVPENSLEQHFETHTTNLTTNISEDNLPTQSETHVIGDTLSSRLIAHALGKQSGLSASTTESLLVQVEAQTAEDKAQNSTEAAYLCETMPCVTTRENETPLGYQIDTHMATDNVTPITHQYQIMAPNFGTFTTENSQTQVSPHLETLVLIEDVGQPIAGNLNSHVTDENIQLVTGNTGDCLQTPNDAHSTYTVESLLTYLETYEDPQHIRGQTNFTGEVTYNIENTGESRPSGDIIKTHVNVKSQLPEASELEKNISSQETLGLISSNLETHISDSALMGTHLEAHSIEDSQKIVALDSDTHIIGSGQSTVASLLETHIIGDSRPSEGLHCDSHMLVSDLESHIIGDNTQMGQQSIGKQLDREASLSDPVFSSHVIGDSLLQNLEVDNIGEHRF